MRRSKGNRSLTAGLLTGVVAVMLGVTFYSPTLYRLFCQATGYAGTPRTEDVVRSHGTGERMVTVRFDANVNSALPWQFRPLQKQVKVKLGEEALVHYAAANRSDQTITGTATFNVVPEKVAPYFSKIECFCFTEQTLMPGQEISMPVLFYVDPALAEDADAQEVTSIVLSYTFYRTESTAAGQGTAAEIAVTRPAHVGG